MITCLVLGIFLTESYSLALLKRLSIPLMSASRGHGVAFLPELGGSLSRAPLRSFLNLLSRLGRDCPPIVRTKAPHAPIPHLVRLVDRSKNINSTSMVGTEVPKVQQTPLHLSVPSFAKTLASPMDAWPPQCHHELSKSSGCIASPGLFWSTSNSTFCCLWEDPVDRPYRCKWDWKNSSANHVSHQNMRHTSPD